MSAAERRKTFKRSSWLERGHIPNNWSIAPIVEVVVAPDGLTITTRPWWLCTRTWQLPWTEIDSVELVRTKRWKGMGETAANFTQTICRVKSQGNTFDLDVSMSYPDFKKPWELLAALSSHKQVVGYERTRRGRRRKST